MEPDSQFMDGVNGVIVQKRLIVMTTSFKPLIYGFRARHGGSPLDDLPWKIPSFEDATHGYTPMTTKRKPRFDVWSPHVTHVLPHVLLLIYVPVITSSSSSSVLVGGAIHSRVPS